MNTPIISGGDNFITALGKISKKATGAASGRKGALNETKVNDQRLQSPSKRNFRNMNAAGNDSDEDGATALPDLRKDTE